MTANQMTPAIGFTITVWFESIEVTCKVIDVKNSYGKVRLLIQPISGKGTQWIETTRVSSVVDAGNTASTPKPKAVTVGVEKWWVK